MFRSIAYWSLFSAKNMFLFKSIQTPKDLFLFKRLFSSHKLQLPPMKLLTSGVQQKPPPFYPEPPNYSFLVALCFGILVIFNRK